MGRKGDFIREGGEGFWQAARVMMHFRCVVFSFLIFRTIHLDTPDMFNSLTHGYDTRYTIYNKE